MSGKQSGGAEKGLLLTAVVVGFICIYGVPVAALLRLQLTGMAAILAPIAGTVLLVVFATILVRNYWSRW